MGDFVVVVGGGVGVLWVCVCLCVLWICVCCGFVDFVYL